MNGEMISQTPAIRLPTSRPRNPRLPETANSPSATIATPTIRLLAAALFPPCCRTRNHGEGEFRRATAPYQRRDLVPVDVTRGLVGHGSGDPETLELGHAPLVHEELAGVDDFVADDRRGRFHRSSLQPGWLFPTTSRSRAGRCGSSQPAAIRACGYLGFRDSC